MVAEPRELRPAEMVSVADKLAQVASEGGIQPSRILLQLDDVADTRLKLSGAPADIWLRIVRALHAGVSAKAGFRSDAVARLIETLAAEVQGNAELNDLAYKIGQGYQARPSSPSIFLGYAHADRR